MTCEVLPISCWEAILEVPYCGCGTMHSSVRANFYLFFSVYFWYVPHLVDFLANSEALVLSSSSVTYLLAASIQEDGICNERGQ